MKIILYFLFCAVANTIPIQKSNNAENNFEENKKKIVEADTVDNEVKEVDKKTRAGIIDSLNPFNKNPSEQRQTNKNNDDGPNNNPLQAVQNLFSNAPQFFNGSNPFEQLFSSQSGGNFLDNLKIFVVGTQGIVMPASSMVSGFQNLMGALGNVGNLMQVSPPPILPSGK